MTLDDTARPDSQGVVERQNLLILIQLRWIAVFGQMVMMTVAHLAFGLDIPLQPMAGVLAALVALNIFSLSRLWKQTPVSNAELFAALAFDVAALTTQLYFSGGATNPFTFLFLLQVTLGAVLLNAWSTWALVGLTGLCFAGLTSIYRPMDLVTHDAAELFSLHIYGTAICFALDATLLVVFVTRINRNLRERDARLAGFRQQAAEEDHIVRMGLLASGAAHELGTPLATLSVILGDWRRMPALTADPELGQEIAQMQAEVQRCKTIVTGILLSAGQARGESAGVTTLHTFFDDLVEDWRSARSATNLRYNNAFGEDLPIVSESALRQVMFNLLDNAFEASPRWVGFSVVRNGDMLVLTIRDVGPGFVPDILAQIGKPYQSSKGRPGGGLGLFLVVNVVRKLGGRVVARNRQTGGAVVILELPLAALRIEARHGG
ncbi:ATP-binding protein [Beijerinckia sp. L45]|uniref:ATP-binding protein n=1 Tax=Beijerinckia sp. L45 TaxID=1641855 RepID=UPI001FED519F|nr:ATP-binding protein [Beijerinckia sp. L45]